MATIHKFTKSYFEGASFSPWAFRVPGNIKLPSDIAVDDYQLKGKEQKIKHLVGLVLSFASLFSTSAIKSLTQTLETVNFLYQGKDFLSILSESIKQTKSMSAAADSPLICLLQEPTDERLAKLDKVGFLKIVSCVRSIVELVLISRFSKVSAGIHGIFDLVTNSLELKEKPSVKKTLQVATNAFYLISLVYSERSRSMECKWLIASLLCQSLFNFYIAARTGRKMCDSNKRFGWRMSKLVLHGLLGAARIFQGNQCYQFFQQMEQQRRSQKALILLQKLTSENIPQVAQELEEHRRDYGKSKVVFIVSENPETQQLGQQLADQLQGSLKTEVQLNEQTSPLGLDKKAIRRLRETRARSFAEMVHSYPLDSETLTVILEDQSFMKNLCSVLSKLNKKGHPIDSAHVSSHLVVMTKDLSNKMTVWDQFKFKVE
ncbi:MAG: hypothetical protein JSS10_00265 [Verrucomicrobia bacterium]|nr:hypothetical protein [Verrucomicrobiota bacterium]